MAENRRKLGPSEMLNLARRLRARADSVLSSDQPERQRDLREAADIIEALLRQGGGN